MCQGNCACGRAFSASRPARKPALQPRLAAPPGQCLRNNWTVPALCVAQTIVVCRLRTVLELGRPPTTMACPTAKSAAPLFRGRYYPGTWVTLTGDGSRLPTTVVANGARRQGYAAPKSSPLTAPRRSRRNGSGMRKRQPTRPATVLGQGVSPSLCAAKCYPCAGLNKTKMTTARFSVTAAAPRRAA